MKGKKKFDFSGYATKNNIKCSDGRTIRENAFKHMDGATVPLVWQHMHNSPDNILGHALLENRSDGVYAYARFNDTPSGENAKKLVKNGDIKNLSIYANKLKQQGSDVIHGAIREVSLVLTGANPGALIDNLEFAHSDGTFEEDLEEAIIHTGLSFSIDDVIHADEDDKTVQDIIDTMTEEQKNVMYVLVGAALDDSIEHSDDYEYEDEDTDEGGFSMKRNVFEKHEPKGQVLSHSALEEILQEAKATGSLKDAFLAHEEVQEYGIENIDYLFPEARTISPTPTLIQRDQDWVQKLMGGLHRTPFSRIKSVQADITAEEARAKGYIKGNLKKDEVFKLLKRVTTPTTIYKKQKLDRDDIVDIVDLDVVAFVKMEMRLMLNEEIARAILIGDGRQITDDDKIPEENIRPVYTDDDLYSHKVTVAADVTPSGLVKSIIRARKHYKGKGMPNLYTTTDVVTDMLLEEDKVGRRLYSTMEALKAALRVNDIVEVPVMEGVSRTVGENELDLVAILLNPRDYTAGADKGGEINLFDDFDIDYNQYKYLMETRMSGALKDPKTAIVIEKAKASVEGTDAPVDPEAE